jgi:hypothetical protein
MTQDQKTQKQNYSHFLKMILVLHSRNAFDTLSTVVFSTLLGDPWLCLINMKLLVAMSQWFKASVQHKYNGNRESPEISVEFSQTIVLVFIIFWDVTLWLLK